MEHDNQKQQDRNSFRATGRGAALKCLPQNAFRKREVVLRLLRGELVEALSCELSIEIYRQEQWREKALSGIDVSLKERQGDPVQTELDQAMRRIGELTVENELLWQLVRKPVPLAKRRSPK